MVDSTNPVETVDLVLSVGEAFMSSEGKKFIKGDIYTLLKEEANKLLAVKGDYDIRFFKKSDGVGKKAVPKDTSKDEVLPTVHEIAASMNEENAKQYEAAKALNKADAIASATRGQGDPAIEAQLAQKARIAKAGPTPNNPMGEDSTNSQPFRVGSNGIIASPNLLSGEMDTAESKPRGRGRPAGSGVPI